MFVANLWFKMKKLNRNEAVMLMIHFNSKLRTMRKYLKVSTKFEAINHFKENKKKSKKARLFNVTPKQILE